MRVIRFDLEHLPEPNPGLVLALGAFDGLHLGHQRLLLEAALRTEKEAGVLLFDIPPRGKGSAILTSLEDKIALCYGSRLDVVYVLRCGPSFWDLSPEEFMDKVLLPLGAVGVVCGRDFRFGKMAKGDPELLKSKFQTHIVPEVLNEAGEKISSSSLRRMIAEHGDVEEALKEMGHPYALVGKVVEGLHNGRKFGFPTANLALVAPYVLPEDGVYAGIGYVGGKPYRAMINVGKNPTIGVLQSRLVEAHLIGLHEEIYGQTMRLSFLFKGRRERDFGSLEALQKQLKEDYEWTLSQGKKS